MKTVRFFFALMIAAVLSLGTSLAQEANHPSQQVVSRSGERSADQQKDEVRNDKGQGQPKPADDTQLQSEAVTRSPTKHRPSASHSKPVPTYRSRPVKKPTASSRRIAKPGSVAPLEAMASKAATTTPNKAVSHRSPSDVSPNGQQFMNSHDPGAHLAASGGPATIARGTAAINGTGMKRKP